MIHYWDCVHTAADERSTGWKFSPDTSFCSHGTVHYFLPVHTEIWTGRRLNFRMVKVIPCETHERSIGQKFVRCFVNVALRWCYTRRFATTSFSATQHYNIVATLLRMVTTLFQHCYAMLRSKSSLRIVSRNITFRPSSFDANYRTLIEQEVNH